MIQRHVLYDFNTKKEMLFWFLKIFCYPMHILSYFSTSLEQAKQIAQKDTTVLVDFDVCLSQETALPIVVASQGLILLYVQNIEYTIELP